VIEYGAHVYRMDYIVDEVLESGDFEKVER